MVFIQRVIFQGVKLFLLSREFPENRTNGAWWNGNWYATGLGWHVLTQPIRESIVKVVEMSLFTVDFLIGHLILIVLSPILFIPCADRWHTSMLMWIKSSKSLRSPVFPTSIRKKRHRKARRNALLFFSLIILFAILIVIPILVDKIDVLDISHFLPRQSYGLIQPNHQDNNDTGDNAPQTVLRSKPDAPEIVSYQF
ncbi:unnamed protein product [Ambrosiozyma monospora]|uniref:Unnamed protein product n=1 Tax=Ambrosiozyma monospora TaxID=43982 RepID=A0ACB5U3P6_AMBMO|nr:unnamed protein product [Ambrosiozyma monospora]